MASTDALIEISWEGGGHYHIITGGQGLGHDHKTWRQMGSSDYTVNMAWSCFLVNEHNLT